MRIHPTPDDLIELTASWTGDRFPDGRPRVPDDVLDKIRLATTEQAWAVLLREGYERQFAGGWRQTHPGTILVGRAVTAAFLPHRPDFDEAVVRAGAREGHLEADRQNSWIIQTLQPGDVMVTDIFGKVKEGTVVGDNLSTAVAARTGVGAVIDGGIRDYQGIVELGGGVNFFFRDVDPTPIRNVTLAGINIPIRIGEATVLPGDVVLGTPSGVIFIPAHLAAKVAEVSEEIRIRDVFGKLRLAHGVYTSAEIDVPTWAPHIEADFQQWRKESR
ncbi:RraA family protein [Thermasporomyces composti]|jgi:regulator of RNase E activity RraA|uniref:Putative 4-hydroxy-4-methyl-2-oxoglutarate aldolase n=1 Tax=Thermasporomyces composti TaxID=696763 RepID=A0A3D9V729_THECX|nr:RraA family protein [Thermasporomyces composti]REF34845.1 regulator of RNase E activity RraA [Thermasporomyces composti]